MVSIQPGNRWEFKWDIQVFLSRRQQLINEINTPIFGTFITASPEVSYTIGSHAIVLSSAIQRTALEQLDISNNVIRVSFDHHWQITDNIGWNTDYSNFTFGNQSNFLSNHFLNTEIRFKIVKWKSTAGIRVSNILDRRTFQSVCQSNFFITYDSYNSRPRQFHLFMKRTF